MKFPVEKMFQILKISRISYYSWLNYGLSKRWLTNERIMFFIKKIFEDSYQSYGAPRIRQELKKYGYFVSRRRISKLMKLLGLYVKRSYKFRALTDSNHKYPVAPNLLNQNFTVFRENQVWVSDMTYISTKQGWMYLTVIIDLFNRKVVGWSFSKDLIFHSDRGSQYASGNFTNLIKSYDGLVCIILI